MAILGFIPHRNDGSIRPQSLEYLPAAAITPKVGLLLKQNSDGNLAIFGGNTESGAPTHIAMCNADSALTAGTVIPALRINHDMVFETSFSASASAIKPGMKVAAKSDGLQVTAATTKGVAEVVGMEGTASGSTCYVRF